MMASQKTSDMAERIWRAVLASLKDDELLGFHLECENRPPEQCVLYDVIVAEMGGGE